MSKSLRLGSYEAATRGKTDWSFVERGGEFYILCQDKMQWGSASSEDGAQRTLDMIYRADVDRSKGMIWC